MKRAILSALVLVGVIFISACQSQEYKTISVDELRNKIAGGWIGKAYGVSFGGPTEFQSQGKIIEEPLALKPEGLKWLTWQDDMYVNMALLKAVDQNGLDVTADDFAEEFAYGDFMLWHANGQGRQNILEGIPPELSGHPKYNPHADDIDFQIESDFIGLYSPGLPKAAQSVCDRAGRLMNWGDGVYGGYFVTCMYAAAFIYSDIDEIVEAGLNCLPQGSGYRSIISDVIKWYKENPDDWRLVWQLIEDKYNNDLCPWGVGRKFNIQASLNGAYIALGLLYGRGDIEKTVDISTRCGQDSDCNPANAAGIIGTMLGKNNLPQTVMSDFEPYMDSVYHYTPYSINSATDVCLRLAQQNIEKSGGISGDDEVKIKIEDFTAEGPAEISFPTLQPLERYDVTDDRIQWKSNWEHHPDKGGQESMMKSSSKGDFMELQFAGNAVYVQGDLNFNQGILEFSIDGDKVGRRDMYLPKKWLYANQSTAVWITGLPDGKHTLRVTVTGDKNEKSEGIMIGLGKIAAYTGDVAEL